MAQGGLVVLWWRGRGYRVLGRRLVWVLALLLATAIAGALCSGLLTTGHEGQDGPPRLAEGGEIGEGQE